MNDFCRAADYLNIGLIILDGSKRIKAWNKWVAQHSGKESEAVLGESVLSIFPDIAETRIDRALDKALKQGTPSILSGKLLDQSFPLFRSSITGLEGRKTIVQSIHIKPASDMGDGHHCVISILDITSSDVRERALRRRSLMLSDLVESLQQKDYELTTLFQNTQLGILTFDGQGMLLTANPSALNLFEYDAFQLDQLKVDELLPNLCDRNTQGQVNMHLPTRDEEWELTGKASSGQTFPVSVSANSIRSRKGGERYFVFIRDISEQKQAERQLRQMARFDGLTGLYNRFSFMEVLSEAIEVHRREGTSLSVFFIDLDRFKAVNDSQGHDAGDQLLKQVGERLSSCCRQSDRIARWAGDEFAILLQNQNTERSTITVAEKLLQVIAQPYQIKGREVFIHCSIGIAQFPDDGVEPERLIFCADQAMYQAKADGKGIFRFFTQAMNERTIRRLKVESELRRALATDQFDLCYQPQVDVHSGKVFGVEALIRWHHPEQGVLYPDDFIPVAEDCGLIGAIGEWVMARALETASQWHKRNGYPLSMSINLSPKQFVDDSLIVTINKLIGSVGFPAESLVLEITEGHLMGEFKESRAALNSLKSLGVKIAIDDFGTGYSSLAYLRQLPVDIIKIDKAFLQDAATNSADANVVNAIIDLAHALKLEVVAEGIEHMSQYDLLRANGCDLAQGFYIGKPMQFDDLVEWISGRAINSNVIPG